MTIDNAIAWLNTDDYESKGFADATSVAIETMRKYQKIEQIANDKNINGDLLRMSEIRWVLKDGNGD